MLAGGVHFHLSAFKLVQLLADGSLQGIVGKQNSISALSDPWAAAERRCFREGVEQQVQVMDNRLLFG